MEQKTTAKFLSGKDEHRVLDPKYRFLPNYLTTNIQVREDDCETLIKPLHNGDIRFDIGQ